MVTISLATVLFMLTVIGGIGIAFVVVGIYQCHTRRNDSEGVIMLLCGMFTCIITAILTNEVLR